MMGQIKNFELYNGSDKFKTENNFEHTLISEDKENISRSNLGIKKKYLKKSQVNRSHHSHKEKDYTPTEDLTHLDLNQMQETVIGMLGVKRYEVWILNLNIGNVMHLSPLGLQEMNLQLDNSHELTRDAILEKIVLLSISYFCVGTELRFLSQNKKNKSEGKSNAELKLESKNIMKESEKWQAKAVETACTFLPSECPLVGHVISSYQKHHSIINQPILEDEVLDEQLTFVRPFNEVKQDSINYHQIIKNHVPVIKTLHPKRKQSAKKAPPSNQAIPHFYEDLQERPQISAENFAKYSKFHDLEEKKLRMKALDGMILKSYNYASKASKK